MWTELIEKKSVIFDVKSLHCLKFLLFLDLEFARFFWGYGWTWTKVLKIKSETGSQIMAVTSSFPERVCQIHWSFNGQFRKIWPFLKCAGHERIHLAI